MQCLVTGILLLLNFPLASLSREEGVVRVEMERVKGSRLSRATARGYIPYPPDVVFRYILAYERYGEYMPHMSESRVLERGEDEMTVFQRLNLPWPLADRWYRAKVDIDSERRTVGWETEEGNLESCTGSWEVKPADGGSRVIYSVLLDPGGYYPAWVVNSLQRRSLPAVIRALREFIREQEGEGHSGKEAGSN